MKPTAWNGRRSLADPIESTVPLSRHSKRAGAARIGRAAYRFIALAIASVIWNTDVLGQESACSERLCVEPSACIA